METYELEKPIWTEDDFEITGWHNAKVRAMLANPDLREYLMDLDYIFEWAHFKDGSNHFKFWVFPATMVFENTYNVKIDTESQQGEIQVADLHMENAHKARNGKFTEYTFRFECQEGEITLRAFILIYKPSRSAHTDKGEDSEKYLEKTTMPSYNRIMKGIYKFYAG